MNQGQYPIGSRVLAGTDTVTGVVTGATADIPLAQLAQFVLSQAGSLSGPTGNRPASPSYVGQPYFDTTLGFPVYAKTIPPATVVWVDAAGVAQ